MSVTFLKKVCLDLQEESKIFQMLWINDKTGRNVYERKGRSFSGPLLVLQGSGAALVVTTV